MNKIGVELSCWVFCCKSPSVLGDHELCCAMLAGGNQDEMPKSTLHLLLHSANHIINGGYETRVDLDRD